MDRRGVELEMLAIGCQLNDSQAWEELVVQWHPRLCGYVFQMVGNQSEVDDIVQTIWTKILRSLVNLQNPAGLEAWIFQIARRTVMDHLRAAYRQPCKSELPDLIDSDVPLDDWITREDLAVQLGRLHPAERELLVLHYLQDLPLADVADLCGLPVGTVKSRLHRARRSLWVILQGENDE